MAGTSSRLARQGRGRGRPGRAGRAAPARPLRPLPPPAGLSAVFSQRHANAGAAAAGARRGRGPRRRAAAGAAAVADGGAVAGTGGRDGPAGPSGQAAGGGGVEAVSLRAGWGIVRHRPRDLAVAGGALLLATACVLVQPLLSGTFIQLLIQQATVETIPTTTKLLLGGLVAAYLLEPLCTLAYVRTMTALGLKVVSVLRAEYFRALLMHRIEFFDSNSTGQLTTALSRDFDSLKEVITNNLSRDRGPRAILETIGATAILFAMSPQLAPVLLVTVAITGVNAALFAQKTRPLFLADMVSMGEVVDTAGEAFRHVKTVRAYAAEPHERVRFMKSVIANKRTGEACGNARSLLEGVNRAAIYVSLLTLYAWGGFLVSKGYIGIQVLISGIGYTFSLIFCTQGIVNSLADFRKGASALERLNALLAPELADPSVAKELPPGTDWWRAGDQAAVEMASFSMRAECANSGNGDAAVAAARAGALEIDVGSFSCVARGAAGGPPPVHAAAD